MRPIKAAEHAYDRFYYANYFGPTTSMECGRSEHWLPFFDSIAERLVSDIGPGTVLDAGCAMCMLVESLCDRGVDAYGIDISTFALQHVRADVKYCSSQASVIDPFPRQHDLITCIETVEHLAPLDAERAVANICRPGSGRADPPGWQAAQPVPAQTSQTAAWGVLESESEANAKRDTGRHCSPQSRAVLRTVTGRGGRCHIRPDRETCRA